MVVLSELSEGSSSSSSTHGYSSSARDHTSSTHGQCSSTDGHIYDVFLSFRGLDTRHSFTDHLHKALINANITTFLDDEEIQTGEDMKPELESAIKASWASIIVLSKNYASSTWCLDELVLILEQRITSNHIVIPIFYHVEPTHVRKQQSTFGDAMAKHRRTMEAETNADKKSHWALKIDLWNKALVEISNLKGKDVNGRLEPEFIEEIVSDIYGRLRVPLRSVPPQLIGRDYSIDSITSWLKDGSSHTIDILTILGMGGIGKTSLAKYVYGSQCHQFHASSYLEDVSRRSDGKFNGLLDLQKQLCNDILKTSPTHVHDVSTYTSKIENAVARKRVFLVLDDIDSIAQLDALLGKKGFHPGSKIIITTRDRWLTKSCALFKTNMKPEHVMHFLGGLYWTESLQLLCFHAFISHHPKAGYEEVTDKLVKYCEGHPLALEVLGKSLHNRDVAYWEGCIEGLKKEIVSPINNVLRMSFDSLSNNDKELFKHIACFFVGIDRDITETILSTCDISTKSGITNLIDRCLLSIGPKNELKMHQLVQEMGKLEVRQESSDKPWKRSRLWCHKESLKVLKRKKGKGNLLGLAIDMRMLEKEKLAGSSELKTDTLSNMDSLMLLQLNYVHMSGSYENFPQELKGLCMHGFHSESIPLDLPMKNLVALDMSYSNIESFVLCYNNNQPRPEMKQKLDTSCLRDKRLLGSLKILNLSFCKQLRRLGDFDHFPALETLIVRKCISLVEVCESIEQCVELVLIDLSYCKKLEKLPRNIGMLKKVKTMMLDSCNIGKSRIEEMEMGSQIMLKDNSIGVNTRASYSSCGSGIPNDLKFFAVSLPSSLVKLSLANSNLSTGSFPMDLSCLSVLKELYLDRNPIRSMPSCVRTLPGLEILSMSYCHKLKSVEHPPHALRQLMLDSLGPGVPKVVFDQEMSPLVLSLDHADYRSPSYEIQGIVSIQPMVGVEEKLLHSLGWTNMHFRKDRPLRNGFRELAIQMYYEFGIFSTLYEQEEMPNWFRHRSAGPSISFTIPSSPKKLRGLNFCFVHSWQLPGERFPFTSDNFVCSPIMTVSNITKNRTWIYKRYLDHFNFAEKFFMLLSHWMIGMNDMEGGDQVTITVTITTNVTVTGLSHFSLIKECGVSLVYDDANTEEDVLGYYKSWNHIIGGDLSPFQTTTGEYLLRNFHFFAPNSILDLKVFGYDFSYKVTKSGWFRALSRTKPAKIGHAHEGDGESSGSGPSHETA